MSNQQAEDKAEGGEFYYKTFEVYDYDKRSWKWSPEDVLKACKLALKSK